MGIYTINHKCYITTATIFNALLPARELPTRNARVRNAPKIPCSCSCTAGTKLLICLCKITKKLQLLFLFFLQHYFYHNFFSFLWKNLTSCFRNWLHEYIFYLIFIMASWLGCIPLRNFDILIFFTTTHFQINLPHELNRPVALQLHQTWELFVLCLADRTSQVATLFGNSCWFWLRNTSNSCI